MSEVTPLATGKARDAAAGVAYVMERHPDARAVVVFVFDGDDIVHMRYGHARGDDLAVASVRLQMLAAQAMGYLP